MKIKTSELKGPALDWAVAKCEGIELVGGYYNRLLVDGRMSRGQEMLVIFKPSTDWAQAGPIIEREGISLVFKDGDCYANAPSSLTPSFSHYPLVAAMRCYVASKLGDVVEVPDDLMEGKAK